MTKRMFLVDGSNHAFRVHFALPPMHAPDGFPTSALYGFTTMFARILRVYKPDYVVVCFDIGKSFRSDLYPDYKGHRPGMPDDLRAQWPHFPELVEGFGFKSLAIKGYEADDVIGTIAKQHASEDLEVWLVTGDKDYYQLVDENIRVLDLMKDVEIGIPEVEERFGVPPELITDVRGLSGDKSDNIPGVPGIGDKTAAKLVNQYGTLEAVIEASPGIKGKRGENLRNHKDDAILSKQLCTIFTEVPLPYELDDYAPRGMQTEELGTLFEKWNFGRVARKLLRTGPEVDTSVYRTIDTEEGLQEVIDAVREAGRVGFDTETTSLDTLKARIVGISLAWSATDAVYIPMAHTEGPQLGVEPVIAALKPLLEDPDLPKIGQNLKYDLKVCANHGITLRGIGEDTLLLDYVLAAHERSHKLDTLASRYLSHNMTSYQEVSKGEERSFHEVPIDEATHYAAEDAQVALQLADKLVPRLSEGQEHVYREIELPLMPILAELETNGILLDTAKLKEVEKDVAARVKAAEKECHEIYGGTFKVGSVKELRRILFDEMGYEVVKKTKTGPSTDSTVLEKLAGQRTPDLPAAIIRWRELSKLLSTYLKKLPTYVSDVTGRVHTNFGQAVAATGRLSSNDPNLQNVPIRTAEGRRIRECFVPAEGHVFLSCDYSQVELRILAHVCGSETLQEAFQSGDDIHRRTASEVFDVPLDEVDSAHRNAAKAINYGLLYGMSAFRLGNELGIDFKQAEGYMRDYFGRMPEVEGFINGTKVQAREDGYVTTLYGRRRILPTIHSKQWSWRMAAEREAVNTIIQGTAADIMKIAMLRVHERLRAEGHQARMLLQVHDELLLEVPAAEVDVVTRLVVEEMEGAAELAVPLVVNSAIGHNWNEAHG